MMEHKMCLQYLIKNQILKLIYMSPPLSHTNVSSFLNKYLIHFHIISNMNSSCWINLSIDIIKSFDTTKFTIAHICEIIFLFKSFLILDIVFLKLSIFLAEMTFVLITIPLHLHTCFLFSKNILAFLRISFSMIYIMS